MDHLEIAGGQRGVAHRDQLLAGGLSEDVIFRLVRKGDLVTMLPSVYRIRGAPRSWLQLATAVSLWSGERSAITGRAAAAVYGLDGFPLKGPIDVVTLRSRRAPRADVRVRRLRDLPDDHLTVRQGITVVVPPRLLMDLSTALDATRLEKALEDMLRRGLCSMAGLNDWFRKVPTGTPGLAACKKIMAQRKSNARPTASDLETDCLQTLRRSGAPAPTRQHWISDGSNRLGRIDLAYPSARLGIEVDSYEWHGDFTSFHRDRERYNSVVSIGWRLLLYTSRTDKKKFAEQVLSILAEVQPRLL